jgi:hypothetical protein
MEEVARERDIGSNEIYYLPDFSLKPYKADYALVYNPTKETLFAVSREDAQETLNSYNDVDNWIKPQPQHYAKLLTLFKNTKRKEDHTDFFNKLRKETGLPTYNQQAGKPFFKESFEQFYLARRKTK